MINAACVKCACDIYDKQFSHIKKMCHLHFYTGEKPHLCRDNSERGPVQKGPIMFPKKAPSSRKYRPCYNVKVQGNIAVTQNFHIFFLVQKACYDTSISQNYSCL